jgi:hypothetical protein
MSLSFLTSLFDIAICDFTIPHRTPDALCAIWVRLPELRVYAANLRCDMSRAFLDRTRLLMFL